MTHNVHLFQDYDIIQFIHLCLTLLDYLTLQSDLEEMNSHMRTSEENYNRALVDVTRLSEELRSEHEHSRQLEKMKKHFEIQVKEFQIRIDEAEALGLKGGKKMLQKMEQRVSITETSPLLIVNIIIRRLTIS